MAVIAGPAWLRYEESRTGADVGPLTGDPPRTSPPPRSLAPNCSPAGGAGALTAVAAALPRAPGPESPPTRRQNAAAEKTGGYQETQHVLRYYQTTRV